MEYDAVGRLLKVTDHNSHITGYGYDVAGNKVFAQYDEFGNIKQIKMYDDYVRERMG